MAQKILTLSAGGLLTEVNDAYQGTVTSVAALTLGTTGTDLSSTVANGTTTPVITLQVPTASASNRGALSSTDWSTFNGKQAALGYTAANDSAVVHNTGTETVAGAKTFGSTISGIRCFVDFGTNGGPGFKVTANDTYGATMDFVNAAFSGGSNWSIQGGRVNGMGVAGSMAFSNTSNGTFPLILTPAGHAVFGGNVGFNGTTAIAKPTITGSRGGNAALASLLTALASYGLITDSTTA